MCLFSLNLYLQEVEKYINNLRKKFGPFQLFEPLYTEFELCLYETYIQQMKMSSHDIFLTAPLSNKRGMVNSFNNLYLKYISNIQFKF